MTEQILRNGSPRRLTASERRFEYFLKAARELACEPSVEELDRLLADLIPVRRPAVWTDSRPARFRPGEADSGAYATPSG